MVCAVIGTGVQTGCSNMAPLAATASPQQAVAQGKANTIDYARIAAAEQSARDLGLQVIRIREPALRWTAWLR